MAAPIRKEETDNVITLSVLNGKLGVKPEVRYNKDGSINKSHPNKKAGVSSTVYPFVGDEIERVVKVLNERIENAPDDNKRWIAWRNKVLVVVGMNVGLRASDLCGLRFSYFYNEDGTSKDFYVLMPQKTRKQKKFVKIFFNKTVRKVMDDYIVEYPIKDTNEYVFKSREGNGYITPKSLWRILVDIANEAEISKNVGSHTLRKTWARNVYEYAEDKSQALVMLQECLNHSSSMTTLRYVAIMDDEKKETYESIELGFDWI